MIMHLFIGSRFKYLSPLTLLLLIAQLFQPGHTTIKDVLNDLNSFDFNVNRNFLIDYENNTFIKDSKPFRYISGSFHYFRTVEQKWNDILRKFRLAGLNAVQTYVEWASHQPTPAQNFTFDGNLNLVKFLKIAQKNNLSVILRPGPYIDAERDMGGLPPWLLWQSTKMKVRTTQPDFIYYVSNWFGILLTTIKPYLYKNGGPIIMIQVENEYGSYGCNSEYKLFLRDLIQFHLGNDVVLFTTDGATEPQLQCGSIPGVYSTVDFGPEDLTQLIDLHFATQRTTATRGPLVNSEFYIGWFDNWTTRHNGKTTDKVAASLDRILAVGANVNFYMFYGGSNFGMSSGSSAVGTAFQAVATSYDYDAPLTEAADATEKYFAIKGVISKFTTVPNENPGISPKGNYGKVKLKPLLSIFSDLLLQMMDPEPVLNLFPQRFEELGVGSGFVLYENVIQVLTTDPVTLSVSDLKDRAYVFVDEEIKGVLDRAENIFSIPIRIKPGQKLRLLVENQGRPSFGPLISESKGIGPEVKLGRHILDTWRQYRLRDFNSDLILKLFNILNYGPILLPTINEINSIEVEQTYPAFDVDDVFNLETIELLSTDTTDAVKPRKAGMLYSGTFLIGNETNEQTLDTYINVDGWTKGHTWVNGFNLGRYWPVVGPQQTLYLPSSLLYPFPIENNIILLELEEAPYDCVHYNLLKQLNETSTGYSQSQGCFITLTDQPVLNGPTPY